MIHLVTAITKNYEEKAKPYFDSIEHNSNMNNIVITLDYDSELRHRYKTIRFVRGDSTKVKSPNINGCIQHGGWLEFLQLPDDDKVIFTDADILMQRGLTAEERGYIDSLQDGSVICSYNAGEHDTMSREWSRLESKDDISVINEYFCGEMDFLPCYNTGVLTASVKDWKGIYKAYNYHWHMIDNVLGHYAKQQFLLSCIINLLFQPVIADYDFHTHGHFPVPYGVTLDDSTAYYKDSIIMFRHKI
jgi:hypothetical protein